MTEKEAKEFFQRIARLCKLDSKAVLENCNANDDIDLVKHIIFIDSGTSEMNYVHLSYMPKKRPWKVKPRPIVIGHPFTFSNAYKTFMRCLKQRDIGFYWYFGTNDKWTPLFKAGSSREEVFIELDLRAKT